ncbi:hypothetical protein C9374_001489 [Naegleria lovaniensis]|uniref:DUF1152 domain-containing protein n=1 Tax=Naegleria lovaniensis TaxID=51637 RepID=A0AA88GQS7_NAELO|nr:uncharacterized protein C9374_001489 [Naegleria lovaniensis]KAG2387157.1 hypothetical protein C9374_001489 [Naegleria lovaniensis]
MISKFFGSPVSSDDSSSSGGNVGHGEPSSSSFSPTAASVRSEMNNSLIQVACNCQNILIAGCGGGFDVYSGLPLYFDLKAMNKNVYLANLAFTDLSRMDNKTESILLPSYSSKKVLYAVHADSNNHDLVYFPEKYLCEFLKQNSFDENPIVYTFDRSTGVVGITEGYEIIIQRHGIDLLILVDGGNDSLMRGNEEQLGSPHEDCMSIAGVYAISENVLPMDKRIMTCIGFGVDHFHGVHSSLFFENTSSIISQYDGGFKGAFSVLKEWNCFVLFKQACDYAFKKMPHNASIVSSSIIAAIEGHYGNYHPPEIKDRVKYSTLYINPMMGMYWVYSVKAIANQLMYLSFIKDSQSMMEVADGLRKYRNSLKTFRKPSPFPH